MNRSISIDPYVFLEFFWIIDKVITAIELRLQSLSEKSSKILEYIRFHLIQVKSMFTYTDAIPCLMKIILQSSEEQVYSSTMHTEMPESNPS